MWLRTIRKDHTRNVTVSIFRIISERHWGRSKCICRSAMSIWEKQWVVLLETPKLQVAFWLLSTFTPYAVPYTNSPTLKLQQSKSGLGSNSLQLVNVRMMCTRRPAPNGSSSRTDSGWKILSFNTTPLYCDYHVNNGTVLLSKTVDCLIQTRHNKTFYCTKTMPAIIFMSVYFIILVESYVVHGKSKPRLSSFFQK